MKKGFTLSELLIVILIIAIILIVTIPIMHRKSTDKVDKIKAYMAYSTALEIAKEVVSQMDNTTANLMPDENQIYVAKINSKFGKIWNSILTFFNPNTYSMAHARVAPSENLGQDLYDWDSSLEPGGSGSSSGSSSDSSSLVDLTDCSTYKCSDGSKSQYDKILKKCVCGETTTCSDKQMSLCEEAGGLFNLKTCTCQNVKLSCSAAKLLECTKKSGILTAYPECKCNTCSACPTGQHYSGTGVYPDCTCEPDEQTPETSNPTLTGDFCANVEQTLNTSNSNCTTFIANDSSNFSVLTSNITLNNGLKIYIASNSPQGISELSTETSAYIPKMNLIAKLTHKIFAVWNNILAFFNPNTYSMAHAEAIGYCYCPCAGYGPYPEDIDYGNITYAACMNKPCPFSNNWSEIENDGCPQSHLQDDCKANKSCVWNDTTCTASCNYNVHEKDECDDSDGCTMQGAPECSSKCTNGADDPPRCTPLSCSACSTGYHYSGTGVYPDCACEPDEQTSNETPVTGGSVKGYTIYIDVNGDKGKGKLNEDVFKFYILTTGQVVPAGGVSTNSKLLSFKVIYNDFSNKNNGKPNIVLENNVSFKDAACHSGYINQNASYCSGKSKNSKCNVDGADCRVVINKPFKGIFKK